MTDDVMAIKRAASYENEGNYNLMFDSIREGLQYNHENYELYLMLGNYYRRTNVNKAYLCYENAYFYCNDADDRKIINEHRDNLEALEQIDVRPCSVVIASYNNKKIMQECIESIRENNSRSSVEIVVVDNASTDGVTEWLREQADIVLVENTVNRGFGYACNQGVHASAYGNDILFLNNDTVVMPNSIFWLRMGLYEDKRHGAVGSTSNAVGNDQQVEEVFDEIDEWRKYAVLNNTPDRNAIEIKFNLGGFAMLVAHHVLEEVGLFDTRFGMGYFEDDDLALRIQKAGYKVILCKNSFIYHYGSMSFKDEGDSLISENREVFLKKHGVNLHYYARGRMEIINLIMKDHTAPIKVLEIGCGMGATLAKIKYLYPNSTVKGIELEEEIARLGANSLDILQGNAETMDMPYEDKYFDYIIFADVLEHLYDPKKLLMRMRRYLAENGKILCSIPNIMHVSVLIPLLKGEFRYREAGILDKTHIRFFTLYSAYEMLTEAGYAVEKYYRTEWDEGYADAYPELYRELCKMTGNDQLFESFQLLFVAGRQ